MTQDLVILGYLGRALSFELSAVQQYLSLARLFELKGLSQAGEKFRHDAHEEMQHVERIIGRMLVLGVAPNASCLRPSRLDGTVEQLMDYMHELETEIVTFYAHAVHYCTQQRDHENRIFFEQLLKEEQQHATSINHLWQQIETGQAPG